jgi:hypothetical protein
MIHRFFLVVALVAVMAGCKSSNDITTGGAAGKEVPAKEWMGTLCTSIEKWRQPVADVPATGDNNNLAEMKPVVVDFLSSLGKATDEMVETMAKAGVPDIEGGPKAAGDFNAALAKTKTSIDEARTKIEGIPDNDPATYPDGLSQLGTILQNDVIGSIQSVAKAIEGLITTYPTLGEAGKDVPSCSETSQ